MSLKRRWTPENDEELLYVIDSTLKDGGLIKTAFEFYASASGRTFDATRRRYFDIKGEDAPDLRLKGNEKPVSEDFPAKKSTKRVFPITAVSELHPALNSVSDFINNLQEQNKGLRNTIDYLQKENQLLNARIAEAEKCEAELNHLLSIINRSRKEAFAGDAAPKKYKVIDGVPVFE